MNRGGARLEREFTAVIVEEGGWYIAWAEELPGAMTQGRTIEEARENLKEAIQLILEARREIDDLDHVGRTLVREPISVALP